MGPLLRFVSALVCVLAVTCAVAIPAEAGGFFARQAGRAASAVRVRTPGVCSAASLIVPQTFGVQRVVVPQAFSLPIIGSGCGALIVP